MTMRANDVVGFPENNGERDKAYIRNGRQPRKLPAIFCYALYYLPSLRTLRSLLHSRQRCCQQGFGVRHIVGAKTAILDLDKDVVPERLCIRGGISPLNRMPFFIEQALGFQQIAKLDELCRDRSLSALEVLLCVVAIQASRRYWLEGMVDVRANVA